MIVVLSRFRAVSDGSGLARDKAGGMLVTVCVWGGGGGSERSMIVVLSRFRAVSDGSGLARDKAGGMLVRVCAWERDGRRIFFFFSSMWYFLPLTKRSRN